MNSENELDFKNLQVDKEDPTVSYNDQLHKYWVKNTNQPCISVTTLIHKFTTFDEHFWSCYKALEALVDSDKFKSVKSNLLDTKKFDEKYLNILDISSDTFTEKRNEILAQWDAKREASCLRGTAIHKEHELEHLSGNTKELQHLGLGGKFIPNTTNVLDIGQQKVYPEMLLSYISDEEDDFRLAGQADLIIVDGSDVYILDYKTNESIDKKSYFDFKTKKSTMMKYPLNNLQDTNFWHYSMQLSTYAWMIEKKYPGVNIKLLMLIHYDHNGNCTTYECDYLKSDVEKMLSYYKKELKHEKFKESRKKIKF